MYDYPEQCTPKKCNPALNVSSIKFNQIADLYTIKEKTGFKMSNNDILKKLRIALELRDDDIIHILGLSGFNITKSELGAFFRADDHPNFKPLGDQILRKFLNGLITYKRGSREEKP